MQLTRLRAYHEVDASGDKRTCHVFLTIIDSVYVLAASGHSVGVGC